MSGAVKIAFGSLSAPKGSALVAFVGADMKPAAAVTAQFGDLEPLIRAAAKASNFKGAQRTALDILAPAGLDASRLVVVGVAPGKDNAPIDLVDARRLRVRQADRRAKGRGRLRGAGGNVGRRRGGRFRARAQAARLSFRQVQDPQERGGRGQRRRAGVRHRHRATRPRRERLARAVCRRRRRRTRPQPRQRAAKRPLSRRIRRSRQGAGESSGSRSTCSTRRRWPSSA